MSQTKEQKLAAAASNYAAVKSKIESDRLLPWSSAPSAQIGEFEVNPLSLRSLADLELCENAIVCGSAITEGDIVAYIWRHHPDYGDDEKREEFIKTASKVKDSRRLVLDAFDHVKSAFAETPEGVETGAQRMTNAMPPIPDIAHYCDEIGAAYSINPLDVADMPAVIVFQLCRAIRLRLSRSGQGPVYRYLEPKELRDAAGETLKILNDGKN